ncbi:MAG: hypothetical protein ABFD82_11675 [Syntrophaceae bacterium]
MNVSTTDKTRVFFMKLSDYRSSGRESHVFKAERPAGLLGAHVDLITSSLKPEENIQYLLYAPIREAGNAPFGIHAEPASHALAVTDKRFLISKDRHIDTDAPTVQDIPFSHVISVEVGNALLLGWLAIRFIENGQVSCASLFYTARGSHHFEAAIREFRNKHGKTHTHLSAGGITWNEVWEHTPKSQAAILKPLTLEDEKPLYLFHSSETWNMEKKRRKKVCLAAEGRLLVTDRGLIHAVDEQPIAPHILSYGVNVCCISLAAVLSAEYVEMKKHGMIQHMLKLQAGFLSAIVNYEILLNRDKSVGVDDFVRTIQEINR